MNKPDWPGDRLPRLGDAEEIGISTRRPDGTLRPFVPIWVVAVGGPLSVRSYRGTAGAWYRRATLLAAEAVRVSGHQAVAATLRLDPAH
ncbi:DUF2255 family protein [Amycolatopsis sp. NPDC003676]